MAERFIDRVDALDAGAVLSPCRRWRYLLWRRWDPDAEVCAFICLNPSTADETRDDPTVRRCIGFAKSWGYGSLWVLNLFAYRATEPRVMRSHLFEAVGPRNDEYLMAAGRMSRLVVAAWGAHGEFLRRGEAVRSIMARAHVDLHHLGLTKDGHPKHPLYLSSELQPQPWAP